MAKFSIKKIIEVVNKNITLVTGTIIAICGAATTVIKTLESFAERRKVLEVPASTVVVKKFSFITSRFVNEAPRHFNELGHWLSHNWQYMLIAVGVILIIVELFHKHSKKK